MNNDGSVLGILDARVLALQQEQRDAMAKVREIKLRLDEASFIREQISRSACLVAETQSRQVDLQEEDREAVGPTAAVLQLLEKHPTGLRPADIANLLQDKIKTTSKDPRRLIQSVVEGMKRKGRLTQNVSGKLFLKNDASDDAVDGEHVEPPTQPDLAEAPITLGESA